jgi:hypothetical protein
LTALALGAAMLVSAAAASHALSILNTIDDWTCSQESERFAIARTLALVASQGRPELNAEFFEQCMQDAATGVSPLFSKKINEIAAGCVLFNSMIFSDSG